MINSHSGRPGTQPQAIPLPLLRRAQHVCGKYLSGFSGACLGLALLCPLAWANSASEQIEHAAEQALNQLITAQARQSDWQGLRIEHQHQLLGSAPLEPCSQALTVSGAETQALARQRLVLECRNEPYWRATLISQPRIFVKAVHAGTPLERGTAFTPEHLKLTELELGKNTRDFYSRTESLLGLEARRRIRTHQLLSPSLVKGARLITRGESISIVANQQGIAASTAGVALQDGALGEVIRVRNSSSEKVIDGQVLGAGVVTSTY